MFRIEKESNNFGKYDNQGNPISVTSNLLNILLNHMKYTKVYLKYMPEYFSLLRQLASLDTEVVKYLLK